MPERRTILIVDDEPNNVRALRIDLEDINYDIVAASDGVKGWEALQAHKSNVAVILLDRMMPNMNGMQFMAKLKAAPDVCHIPVIMQTAAAEKEQVVEGIQAGVYYYLTKPYDKQVMLSILSAAVRDYGHLSRLREEMKQFARKLSLVRTSLFEVRTLEDAECLPGFLAQFFPDPDRVIFGLSELILNALEHGNLGITYEEKTELNNKGAWTEEILRRRKQPEHAEKIVLISYVKNKERIELRIKDEGEGFRWQEYMEISPERATDNHGRGIAMSKMMSFDGLEYVGCGNEVVCTVNL
ncbi:MAG: response regulator [Rickettsiales bacterium]